jgi:hypothetical protein
LPKAAFETPARDARQYGSIHPAKGGFLMALEKTP